MRRIALLGAVAGVALGAFASSAAAQSVTKSTRIATNSFTFPAGQLCGFRVDASVYDVIHQTFFYDDSGTLVKKFYVVDDTDTWTANGKTLVGHEIFHEEFIYEGGVLQSFIVQGLGSTAGHIILGPDGGVFMGSLEGLQIYDGNFNLVKSAGMPTVAMPSDPTAFCAALSA